MKLLTLTSALLATTASARFSLSLGSASSHLSPSDDKFSVPGDNPLEHCADPKDDVLALKSVDLDPNPPLAGKNLTITAAGTLAADVDKGAYIKYAVKYGLITIIRQTADLCEAVQNVDLECPLKKGDLKLTKDVALPGAIPPGKYTVSADVYTDEDELITCLTASVVFTRGGAAVVEEEVREKVAEAEEVVEEEEEVVRVQDGLLREVDDEKVLVKQGL